MSCGSSEKPLAWWPSEGAAGTGEDGGCGRMVISTSCWSRGDAAVVSEASVSCERARTLLFPLSRRGRLRVKLASASSTGSRAGMAIAVSVSSSAAAACAMSWSRTSIMVAGLCSVCVRRGWLHRTRAGRCEGRQRQAPSSCSGTGSNAPAALWEGGRAHGGRKRGREWYHELQRLRIDRDRGTITTDRGVVEGAELETRTARRLTNIQTPTMW